MTTAERPPVDFSRVSMKEVKLSDACQRSFRILRDHARLTAVLNPDIPDFVSLPWANKPESGEFSLEFQTKAAEILLEVFQDKDPEYILGIGNSGLALATEVTKQLQAKNLGHRHIGHAAIKNLGELTSMSPGEGSVFTAKSYSRNKDVSYYLPPVPKRKRVLIIDDVSAQGSISEALVKELQEQGVEVIGFGVYFNKDWQGGLKRFTAETGVPSFSVIRIASRKENGIALTPLQEALTRFEPVK